MNGRVYDPIVGRFLSPDNYVQAPDNTQSFNRYSYVLNNPLKYTDPTGWKFGFPCNDCNDQLGTEKYEKKAITLDEIVVTAKRINKQENKDFDIQIWGQNFFGKNTEDVRGVNTSKWQEHIGQRAWNTVTNATGMKAPLLFISDRLFGNDMEFDESGEFGEVDEEDIAQATLTLIPGGSEAKAGVQMGLKPAENYVLRAAKDGLYPILKRGKGEVGKIMLKAGDVWKYGISQNPKYRYTKAWLEKSGLQIDADKVKKVREMARKIETNEIVKYLQKNGILPPGNKIKR